MPFSSHHRFTDNPLCRQSATRWLHSYKRCRCPNVWIVIPCSICQPPCFLSLCPPVTNSPPDSPGVSGSYNLILSWVVGVFHTPLGLTLTLFLPLQANIHRNSLLRKPYPFDILLTGKRSACFVASAPFVVLVIHFCLGFGSR